ncbi:MAG: VPLPA-CTERM sorting domain-containing protein [Pseudomonadota bacterium]
MKFLKFVAAAVTAATMWVVPASAVTIAPVGTTDVTVAGPVLSFLSGAGITPSPIDPATASGATFSFPITGGDTSTLTITHSGGVRFEAGAAFLTASNFTIKGSEGTVAADVTSSAFASASQIDIFDLASVDLSGPITADLVINSALNGALGATFAGGSDLGLKDTVFGSASTSPAPVPLPAAMPLLLAGIGAFGALRFSRRKAAS